MVGKGVVLVTIWCSDGQEGRGNGKGSSKYSL
jgi:hypothetical protein